MISEVITPNITSEQITRLAQLEDKNAIGKHMGVLNLGVVQYLGQHPDHQLRDEGYLQFRGTELRVKGREETEEVVLYAVRRKDLTDTHQGIELIKDSLIGKVYDESHLLGGDL